MASPYLTFEPKRVAVSLAVALLLVPAFAVGMEALVEGTTRYAYEIHWFETVPLLVLGVAFTINGWLGEREGRQQES